MRLEGDTYENDLRDREYHEATKDLLAGLNQPTTEPGCIITGPNGPYDESSVVNPFAATSGGFIQSRPAASEREGTSTDSPARVSYKSSGTRSEHFTRRTIKSKIAGRLRMLRVADTSHLK